MSFFCLGNPQAFSNSRFLEAPLTMKFEWDEEKNRKNMRKYGAGFAEAAKVFDDPSRIENLIFRIPLLMKSGI